MLYSLYNGDRDYWLHQNSGIVSDITGGPMPEYGNPSKEIEGIRYSVFHCSIMVFNCSD